VATPDKTQEQASKPDSKDFVEHLRTVHFTLMAVCAALLTLVISATAPKYQRATEQLNDITDAANNWRQDFVKAAALEDLRIVDNTECKADLSPIEFQSNGHNIRLRFSGQNWAILSRNSVNMAVFYRHGEIQYSIEPPANILAFKQN
jgi:hypothetical protein